MSIPPSSTTGYHRKRKSPDFFCVFFVIASQILKSPAARFLLYTTCIVKRVSATGKHGYDRCRSVKTGCCSQIATKAQHRANNPGLDNNPRLSSINRIQGYRRRNGVQILPFRRILWLPTCYAYQKRCPCRRYSETH